VSRLVRTAVLAAAAAAALLTRAASSSTAVSTPQKSPAAGGWERYHAESFTAAAGDLCPFAVRSQVLFDREYVRITDTFDDGSPKVEQYVGPLVVRLTDRRNGNSIQRDLSGRGVVEYARDGSFDFRLQGPVAVGFHPGDSLPPGYYLLSGHHVVHFAADGTRTVTVDEGPERELCSVLGAS